MTTITSTVRTALSANPVRPHIFVTLAFPGGTVRFWNGIGSKTVLGNAYTGSGHLGTIGAVGDTSSDGVRGPNSQRLELELSGLDTGLAAELHDFEHQGSGVTVILALLDSGGAVISDAVEVFVGHIDTMQYSLGETMTIRVTVENFLSYMFRGPDGRRRGDADQQAIFSSDLGFTFVGLLTPNIPWGVATNNQAVTKSQPGGPLTTGMRF